MDYDWTEILKEKSTRELYDIYCGNSFLPETVIPIAKLELEKRHFNFEDIESLKDTFKLEDLEQALDSIYVELSRRTYFNFKNSIIAASFIIIFILIAFKVQNITFYPHSLLIWTVLLCLISFMILLNNFIYKRLFLKFKRLEARKSDILEKFEKRGLNHQRLKLIEDLSSQSMKRLQEYRRVNNILLLILTLVLTLYLIVKNVL